MSLLLRHSVFISKANDPIGRDVITITPILLLLDKVRLEYQVDLVDISSEFLLLLLQGM